MRGGGWLAGALLTTALLAACSGKTPSTEPTAEADSTGGKPQIALSTTCYAACPTPTPLGLPDVAVYADGRLVVVERTTSGSVVRTGKLDSGTLKKLQAKAVEAGLATDGTTTLARTTAVSPPGGGTGTVFTVRLRSTLAVLEVPFLDSDAPAGDAYADPARVGRLADLAKQLRDAAGSATAAATPSAYVVHARLQSRPGLVPKPWPGARLAGFPQVEPGLRCGILNGPSQTSAAAVVDADAAGGSYTEAGRTWYVVGRPLLPHEQNCADVRETVGTSVGKGPRFPGDRRA